MKNIPFYTNVLDTLNSFLTDFIHIWINLHKNKKVYNPDQINYPLEQVFFF